MIKMVAVDPSDIEINSVVQGDTKSNRHRRKKKALNDLVTHILIKYFNFLVPKQHWAAIDRLVSCNND